MKYTIHLSILIGLLLTVPAMFGQDEELRENKMYFVKAQISDADKLKVFNNLWQTVDRLYFDASFNNHDWAKIRTVYEPRVLAAGNKIELKQILNDMVNELKTSHLKVSFEISLSGKTLGKMFGDHINYKQNDILFGYGYSTAERGGRTIVQAVQKDSGADRLGVKPGWVVNSCKIRPEIKQTAEDLIFSESADCIFSTETELEKKLTLSQGWFLSPRANILRESRILPGKTLYLKFNEFDKGSGKWLDRQIRADQSIKTVILDLRENYGGLLDEVKEALAVFFPAQTVVGDFIERDLDEKTLRVGSNQAFSGKVVVLISGSTDSGAEIFAAAIRELGRGKLIGEKSGGQVLNSLNKSLSNGFTLQIAFRDYKTVKGQRIEKTGVIPDVEIPFSIDDFRHGRDSVLETALRTIEN